MIKNIVQFIENIIGLNLSADNYLSIVSIIIAVVGGFFALHQWKKSTKIKCAEYINELTETIRTDNFIKDTIYIMEYDQHWYDENFHESGILEFKIDKTLSYFSYICYLKENKVISDKEFKFFEYQTHRILNNPGVQDYLYNLYHFSKRNDSCITFYYLFKYAQNHEFIDKEFYNPNSYKNSDKYNKYLNW